MNWRFRSNFIYTVVYDKTCIYRLLGPRHSVAASKGVMGDHAKTKQDEPPSKKKAQPMSEKLDEEQVASFPDTLEGFGYKFNEEGRLRNIKTEKPYVFNVYENDDLKNQMRYEKLGEVITEHIYGLLETDTKLQKKKVPVDASDSEAQSFIFLSEDALTNNDKLMLLIHGSGVVRAGQWARRLIINDCLDSGTQLPYIKKAQKEGYGVIVLNTNDNTKVVEGKKLDVRGSESPQEHTKYVWENFVRYAKAKRIAIVAHSFGGVCTMDLVKTHETEMREKNRVFAIALTDSVHHMEMQKVQSSACGWLMEIARNWVTNQKPLDTEVPSYGRTDVPKVSAGTLVHEMTSWKSLESVFLFLNEKLGKVKKSFMKSDL